MNKFCEQLEFAADAIRHSGIPVRTQL